MVHVERGGSGPPVLLMLHGLGATAEVWAGWRPHLAARWPGRWVAPDLPGHGRTAPLATYTFDALASSVVDLVASDEPVVVVGHSMGGVVGLALAGRRPVHGVLGLGIKVAWTPEELARAQALAHRPVAWFDSPEEAVARHLRVSGLAGLVDPGSEVASAGVRLARGRWRTRLDPRAFGVGAPDMPALLAAAQGRVVLARGEHDPMVSDEELQALGSATSTLAGLGHNAHVEDPAAVLNVLLARLGRP